MPQVLGGLLCGLFNLLPAILKDIKDKGGNVKS